MLGCSYGGKPQSCTPGTMGKRLVVAAEWDKTFLPFYSPSPVRVVRKCYFCGKKERGIQPPLHTFPISRSYAGISISYFASCRLKAQVRDSRNLLPRCVPLQSPNKLSNPQVATMMSRNITLSYIQKAKRSLFFET